MAIVNSSEKEVYFQHFGGSLTIQRLNAAGAADGDGLRLKLVASGTFRFTPASRQPVMRRDGNAILPPVAGQIQVGEISITVHHTADSAAGPDDIYDYLMTSDVLAGMSRVFEVVAEFPSGSGATTGKRYTFSKCCAPESGPAARVGVGEDRDTVEITLAIFEKETITFYS